MQELPEFGVVNLKDDGPDTSPTPNVLERRTRKQRNSRREFSRAHSSVRRQAAGSPHEAALCVLSVHQNPLKYED